MQWIQMLNQVFILLLRSNLVQCKQAIITARARRSRSYLMRPKYYIFRTLSFRALAAPKAAEHSCARIPCILCPHFFSSRTRWHVAAQNAFLTSIAHIHTNRVTASSAPFRGKPSTLKNKPGSLLTRMEIRPGWNTPFYLANDSSKQALIIRRHDLWRNIYPLQ